MRICLVLVFSVALLASGCVTTVEGSTRPVEPERPQERDLVEAVRKNPEDPEAHVALGFFYWRYERQLHKARRHYELAIKYAGRREQTGLHYVLGLIYWELKEFDAALREWDDCVNVPAANPSILLLDRYYHMSHYYMAMVQAKEKKDPEKAKEHLQRFLDLGGPSDLEKDIRGALATVYARDKKDPENARKHLKKFRELGGEPEEIRSIEKMIGALRTDG